MRATALLHLISAMAMGLSSGGSLATPTDYCGAYATDFANLSKVDKAIWQQRYDNAHRDCLFQYTAQPVEKVVTKKSPVAKPKVKVLAKIEKKIPVEPVADIMAEAAVAASKPNLIVGSPDWLDYCTRKYVSFNPAKGMYLSKNGIERKCLVTADYK